MSKAHFSTTCLRAGIDEKCGLRRIRNRYHITLLELAAQTGLPENYLGQLEAGDYPALENDLLRIDRALKAIIKNFSEDREPEENGR